MKNQPPVKEAFCFKIFWWHNTWLLSLPSQKRRVRLRARTPPFHGGDTGSNPVRGTTTLFLSPCKSISYRGFSFCG
jgi:hypothetical protein